jgi:hypothetical protein
LRVERNIKPTIIPIPPYENTILVSHAGGVTDVFIVNFTTGIVGSGQIDRKGE